MVEQSFEETLEEFYDIYRETATEHELDVISKKEFRSLFKGIVDRKKSRSEVAVELVGKIYPGRIIDEDRHWVN